mmetsp:Transcript_20431/g.48639  ORF Transcript_20431/g.48639 Transcript_20431/m.48639 type:complete len:87 (+) Transcript_20431:149-409(+)
MQGRLFVWSFIVGWAQRALQPQQPPWATETDIKDKAAKLLGAGNALPPRGYISPAAGKGDKWGRHRERRNQIAAIKPEGDKGEERG